MSGFSVPFPWVTCRRFGGWIYQINAQRPRSPMIPGRIAVGIRNFGSGPALAVGHGS
jgi:hypothetical protein